MSMQLSIRHNSLAFMAQWRYWRSDEIPINFGLWENCRKIYLSPIFF